MEIVVGRGAGKRNSLVVIDVPGTSTALARPRKPAYPPEYTWRHRNRNCHRNPLPTPESMPVPPHYNSGASYINTSKRRCIQRYTLSGAQRRMTAARNLTFQTSRAGVRRRNTTRRWRGSRGRRASGCSHRGWWSGWGALCGGAREEDGGEEQG